MRAGDTVRAEPGEWHRHGGHVGEVNANDKRIRRDAAFVEDRQRVRAGQPDVVVRGEVDRAEVVVAGQVAPRGQVQRYGGIVGDHVDDHAGASAPDSGAQQQKNVDAWPPRRQRSLVGRIVSVRLSLLAAAGRAWAVSGLAQEVTSAAKNSPTRVPSGRVTTTRVTSA